MLKPNFKNLNCAKLTKNATNRHFLEIPGFAKNAFMWHNSRMIGRKQNSSRSQLPRLQKRDSLLHYVEELQSKGRLVFTSAEAQEKLGESANAFIKASLRLIQKDKLFRPTTGFYVIIPAEYRSGKSVPPEWYIDSLMKFHGLPYYVGSLSAAALHGAAHQAPQELQVITTKPLRLITIHRTRIRFLTKKNLSETPVQEMKTHTGFFKVSTPEATAIDLIRYYRRAGYLSNVATVLAELSEIIDSKKLVRAVQVEGEIAHAQRLGYLIDQYGDKKSVSALQKWTSEKETKFVLLRPGWDGAELARDQKWRVIVNDEVEPDL
jgi:predicted transcriptional regulator of viral defense system